MLLNRWMARIVGYLVGVIVMFLYIFPLLSSDLSAYLTVAGSLIAFFAALAGLSFAFCSVLDVPEDKQSSLNAGEKFFYAILCFGFSVAAGVGSLRLAAMQSTCNWIWLTNPMMWILRLCCCFFFASAAGAVINGNDWIIEVLLRRWQQRMPPKSRDIDK